MDFVAHLRKQLGFLERSCTSYDEGFLDEAIRMATVIRVLVHDTKSSTSLLTRLQAKSSIKLLSTTFEPSMETVSFVGLGMMRVGGPKAEYFPQLGDGPPVGGPLQVESWWAQVVMVLNRQRISRRDIVLAAANKDGGAHVDEKLTPAYATLALEGAVGSFIYKTQAGRQDVPIENAHLVSLRQLGYEVLHSPDLLALAKKT